MASTLNFSEQLKARVEPFSRWLFAILELSLLALKTPAYEAASDSEFLVSSPVEEVRGYRLPEHSRRCIESLLADNREGRPSGEGEKARDEYLRLERVVNMPKAKLTPGELADA